MIHNMELPGVANMQHFIFPWQLQIIHKQQLNFDR